MAMAERTSAELGPLTVGGFAAAIAAIYSLLPLASGMAVELSVVDVLASAVFWGALGAAAGVAARKLFATRQMLGWATVAAGWALVEAGFMGIVVLKPTRWPPLVYSALGIGVPTLIACLVALWSLRRAAQDRPIRGVHPALVIVASWALLAGLLLWLPRWLRAFLDGEGIGWVLWGAFDFLWIALAAVAVVLAGAAVMIRHRRRVVVAAIAGGLALLQLLPVALRGGSAPETAGTGPNLVWIMIDSARADHVSAYGYPRATTPNLDRLAAEGTLVRSHVAAGVRTENTYAKMLPLAPAFDRYAPAEPVPLSSARDLLPASALAEQTGIVSTLRAQGYETALYHVYHDLLEDRGMQPWLQSFDQVRRTRMSGDASVGAYFVRMVLGERLDGVPRMDRWAAFRRRYLAEQITTDVDEFLAARERGRPLFLIVHLAGSHDPYYRFARSPQLSGAKSPRVAKYDDALRSADDQVSLLAASIKARLPNTQLFVFADHGSALPGEPRLPEYMTVPLVVVPPLAAPPTAVTSSQDIVATTLALARAEAPRCDGKLARDLRCPAKADEVRVVDHTGHGLLMLAATIDGNLIGLEVGKTAVMTGGVGSAPDACATFARAMLGRLEVSPLETRAGLDARLQRALGSCKR